MPAMRINGNGWGAMISKAWNYHFCSTAFKLAMTGAKYSEIYAPPWRGSKRIWYRQVSGYFRASGPT